MKLNFKEYRDKVYACWIGKNIGGTMGTPYEGGREALDIKGFATEANVVLPNDDLDLQLVWLFAVESEGPYGLDAAKLGEFWLSYITPHWNEYGLGKSNMRRGLVAPISGDYRNPWKHSNGAWIRTEVWASLAPASPDIASKYAMEDAKVDHGAGEGTYAAAFVAAMQSAAFAIPDLRTCIEVGLSYIPYECRVASSVRKVLECYDKKIPARECREIILKMNADIGDGWFESPSNVAYTVLGLVYGEGDFKKSMITAINCGDDTDCTGATVGSTLGILYGTAGIPADWKKHIGDSIVTISIARGNYGRSLPNSCTELTARILKQAPVMLVANNADVEFTNGKSEIPENVCEHFVNKVNARHNYLWRHPYGTFPETPEVLAPYTFTVEFNYARAIATYEGAPDITPNGEIKVHLKIENNVSFDAEPYELDLRWWLPEGFAVEGCPRSLRLDHFNAHNFGFVETDFVIRAGEKVEPTNRLVLEIKAINRPTAGYVPFVLVG